MSQNELREKLYDDIISHAAKDAFATYFDDLEFDDLDNEEFSEEHKKAMEKLFRAQKAPSRKTKLPLRIAVALVAVFAALSVIAFSNDMVRVRIMNFATEVHDKYTVVGIKTNDFSQPDISSPDYTAFEGDLYMPTYMPGNYLRIDEEVTSISYFAVYEDDNSNQICFSQSPGSGFLAIDTENAEVSEIIIGGSKALISIKDTHFVGTIQKGEFIITIAGEFSKEEGMLIFSGLEKIN